jgi:heterodisulfide reductase subunit A
MKKIGVFVCWCGSNIADGVDVNRVVEEVGKIPDVHHAENYMYMCSDPGQQLIKDAIKKENLDAVVVACCSPRMHENTFRKAAGSVGLNPYLVEIANIREQCSWVHQNNKPVATAKAVNIIRGTLAKVRENLPLETIAIGLNKRVLVVGGGIAGLVAARDLADAGYEVVIVEKKPRPGGHMAQLHLTFPYFQSAAKLLEKQIAVIENHPKVKLYCNAEVEQLDGYVGNFEVTISRRPTGVDAARCTGCGACLDACPVSVSDEFNRGLAARAAIYRYGVGAGRTDVGAGKVLVPVIDFAACTHAVDGCDKCAAVCEAGAIDLEAPPEEHVTEEVGAIVMATGYDLMDIRRMPEYGAGQLPDVIDGLAFERMLDPNGPTGGRILRPSDGR